MDELAFMKSSTINIFLFLITFLLGSCQKDILPDNFIIGSSYGVSISSIDDLVLNSEYGNEEVLEIDVDNDGKEDLKFYVYAMDSLGDQDKRGSSVWSVHSKIEFGYKIANEDLFSVTQQCDKGIQEIVYNERSHFFCSDCQNLSQNNERFSFSSPVWLTIGKRLNKEIKWSDKLQILSQFDRSRRFSGEEKKIPVYNNILTGVWDENEEGYLPFRIKISFANYQYGWVKLRVIDHRRIEFSEVALQNESF